MYNCDCCGESVAPKMPCKKVVTKKKRFLHPERLRAKKGVVILPNGKKKMTWVPDPGGWGDQIVEELKMCYSCASKYDNKS